MYVPGLQQAKVQHRINRHGAVVAAPVLVCRGDEYEVGRRC